MRVLIAEDDSVSRLVLQKTLENFGHTVTAVEDGAAALRAADEGKFRLVISDWMMPEMDGLDLCRKLRARTESAYTYLILLTAKDQKEERVLAMASGVDDFLVKPLDRDELAARVQVARRILSMQEDLEDRQMQLEHLHAELKIKNERLEALATTDGLTGLKNHRHFQEALSESWSFCGRSGIPLSVIMLDVDYFKQFNDTFGHPAGDDVLKTVAGILSGSARNYDLAARYGGEEFVLLLPGSNADSALMIAERVREAIESYSWPKRPVTVSLGVSTQTGSSESAASLVEEADRALYCSKRQGKNRATHLSHLSSANPIAA